MICLLFFSKVVNSQVTFELFWDRSKIKMYIRLRNELVHTNVSITKSHASDVINFVKRIEKEINEEAENLIEEQNNLEDKKELEEMNILLISRKKNFQFRLLAQFFLSL